MKKFSANETAYPNIRRIRDFQAHRKSPNFSRVTKPARVLRQLLLGT
jgi:hypothetical protein